jgi:hypothetical protein
VEGVEGRPLAFANELAVGANSREVIEDILEDDSVEEVLEVTEPKVFFEPILLTAPVEDVLVDDARVPIEDTPAVWPEFLELEIPVPVREALREIVPLTMELVRLVRVPKLLCRLFLEAEVPKEGSGDLEREPDDEVEVKVPFSMLGTASLPSSSTFALLHFRTEGILLPLATAVVGWAGAIDDFILGPKAGGPILAFDAAGLVEAFAFVSVGLGIFLATAGAGAFPRFHTL